MCLTVLIPAIAFSEESVSFSKANITLSQSPVKGTPDESREIIHNIVFLQHVTDYIRENRSRLIIMKREKRYLKNNNFSISKYTVCAI